MSRTKNAIKIILSSTIQQLAIVIAGLILPPIIISSYGSEVNGLVNSVKQILSYFSVFSVGLGAAGQVALYNPLHKQEWGKINAIMSEVTLFLNRVGMVFAIFVGILAFVLPVIRDDTLDCGTVAGIVLICGMGSLIEFVFLTRYKILLAADQKQFVVSNVYTQGTVLNTVLSVILINCKAPILIVQFVASFAYLIRMLLLMRKIKKLYPRLDTKQKVTEKTIPNTKEALLYKLSEIIINCIPITLVTFVCGYIDVSIYSVYNLVFASIVMVVNIFSTGLAASFGNQIAQDDYETLRSSFKGYNFVFRTLAFFFYVCSAILIIPFISVYITNSDGVNYLLPKVGVLFALHGICRTIRTPFITLIDAIGNYAENNKANYIEVIINIGLSLVLTIKIGMIGVLIGGLLPAICRSVLFLIKISKTVLDANAIRELMIIGANFTVGMLLYIVLSGTLVDGYLDWFVLAIKVAMICGMICMTLNIIIDYKGFCEFFKRLKGRKVKNK